MRRVRGFVLLTYLLAHQVGLGMAGIVLGLVFNGEGVILRTVEVAKVLPPMPAPVQAQVYEP